MTQDELKKADQRRILKLEGERAIAAIREEWNALRVIENTLGQDVLDLHDFFESYAESGISLLKEADIDDLLAHAKAHPDGLPHSFSRLINRPNDER
jgi:hypothetical protein